MKGPSFLAKISKGGIITALFVFCTILVVMMYGVFVPGQVLFSNDGPLGRLMSDCHRLPQRFSGCWADLNNVGFNSGAASPNISFGLQWLLGPVLFSKFYAIISLLILGLGAWCFFRQSRLAPVACILGGAAMILNSTLFSLACWGLGAQDIAAGMLFFALAAISDTSSRPRWLLLILAGFAVGMVVMEGADVGAILSMLFAAFVIYQALIAEGSRVKNLAMGAGRLVLVILCSLVLAVQTIHGLVSTEIEGVTGTQQDVQTKTQRWDWATQWSLPKTETLGLVVPGLFGYRMDSPSGAQYWGITGRDPAWEHYFKNGEQGNPPTGFFRYSGGGNYIGLLVVLVAIWAAIQSLRPKSTLFTLYQKKWLWFWLILSVVSLLLSFGRFAPFYRIIYALPYFSTIRNPTKFLYLFSFAIVILFAFGIDGLWRRYLKPAADDRVVRAWGRFEKNWAWGCALVLAAGLVGWYIYWQHLPDLERYLQNAHLNESPESVAQFSVHQPEWFALYFFLSAALLLLIFRGTFSGKRATTGVILLGAVLIVDLGMADAPWVIYWDYPDKYSSNPVVDLLRQKPYEQRAVIIPIVWPQRMAIFKTLYKTEWMEQQFPYYNIQTFDVVEMPRIPEDFSLFQKELNKTNGPDSLPRYSKAYQLTNTRYILGPANLAGYWNERVPEAPIQPLIRFRIEPRPGVMVATNLGQLTVASDPMGTYAVFEFPSTLPRAKLYTHWEINTNGADVLEKILGTDFNLHTNVFVAGDVPVFPPTNTDTPPDSAVQIVSYAPKDVVLKANATASSVLLLSCHFHPDWKVLVDGMPEKLLRCNYLLQGVYLPAGAHTVEFEFLPANGLFYVSLAAVIAAVTALGGLVVMIIKSRPPEPVPVPAAVVPALQPQQTKATNKSRKKAQRK
jgi:hypothetical protein